MLESRDFVISPEIAYSPEQLHQFLLSELGANLLNNSQYRIEKISLDARNKNIKALVKIGLYSKDHDFSLELTSILPKLKKNSKRVIVIGSGPAGLFAALKLIELGLKLLVQLPYNVVLGLGVVTFTLKVTVLPLQTVSLLGIVNTGTGVINKVLLLAN